MNLSFYKFDSSFEIILKLLWKSRRHYLLQ